MSTTTKDETQQQAYYADETASVSTEEQQPEESRLFTLGDNNRTALEVISDLTVAMEAAGKIKDIKAFDALADIRSDWLKVHQSLSLSPDDVSPEVQGIRGRLDNHAVTSLEAIQDAMTKRLEQGSVQDVDAQVELDAVQKVFNRIFNGLNELMPKAPALEQTQEVPAQPEAASHVDVRKVGEDLRGKFDELNGQLSGNPQQHAEIPNRASDKTSHPVKGEEWNPTESFAANERRRQLTRTLDEGRHH